MSDFNSLILRFRDLSTPAGTTTVSEHQNIIKSKGYVWWGWWHKQGEIVPENSFRAVLAEIRKSGHYPIFLFDTGKYELHRAKISEIHWSKELTPIATPDAGATPSYYGQAHYLAWFKLSLVEDALVKETELQNWSYSRVDEFFDTKKSVFDAFYDKQLASFVELRNQDRTIWFIRPKTATDGVHEIHVYDRSKIVPSNFSEQVVQLHTPNLLWVSDPHFSKDHHDFPHEPGLSQLNLSEAIRRDLDSLGVKDIGGLLISGDLTWRAAREEFDWAAKFVEDVRSWAKLTASQVLVCPGNHDLAFSNQPWVKGAPATELGDASREEYVRFYEQLYEVKPSEFLACGRRFCVPDGHIVDLVSLNSSVLQQIPDAFQGQGFLGATQLTDAAKAMKWHGDKSRTRAYRIAMLHHHVVPILHREHPDVGTASSVVHDAGALMRWLVEHEVDLVLHGHMHLPSLVKERRALDYPNQEKWHEVAVAALGSSGVKSDHRPNQPNSYGLIEFRREGVRLVVRKISADDSIPKEQRTVYSASLKYEA